MINRIFSITQKTDRPWGPLFLRLIIGFGFMAHGWAKLSQGTPAGFEKLLTQLNVPFPQVTAWVSALVELLGGLFLLLGCFVNIIALPLICIMAVAMFTVNIHYGFSSVKTIGLTPQGPVFGPPGYEINLLYIAGLVSLMITGAGIFSIDAMITRKKTKSL